MKTIATTLALLCSLTAALRADTILIYDTASTARLYGSAATTSQTGRFYLIFDYTTSKIGGVGYFVTKGKKHYAVATFDDDNFVRASVRTSASASSTHFVITSDVTEIGGFRRLSGLFMNGANKLMDLGGGHTGNFPPRAMGVARGLIVNPGAEDGAVVGNVTLRLVPALTTACNTANANLAASIQIVTADLERRGYTKP